MRFGRAWQIERRTKETQGLERKIGKAGLRASKEKRRTSDPSPAKKSLSSKEGQRRLELHLTEIESPSSEGTPRKSERLEDTALLA